MAIRYVPKSNKKLYLDIGKYLPKIRTRKRAAKYGFFLGLALVTILHGIIYFPALQSVPCQAVAFFLLEAEFVLAAMYLLAFVVPKKLRTHVEMGTMFEVGLSSMLATTVTFGSIIPFAFKFLLGITLAC